MSIVNKSDSMTSNGQVLGEALRGEGTSGWIVIIDYSGGGIGAWQHCDDGLWRDNSGRGMVFGCLNNWLRLWSVKPSTGAKIIAIYDNAGNQIA